MDEPFVIPVTYRGTEREFEARLQAWAYGHRFFVQVDGVEVVFERDEEGLYRAAIEPGHLDKAPPHDLLKAIAETIQELLK